MCVGNQFNGIVFFFSYNSIIQRNIFNTIKNKIKNYILDSKIDLGELDVDSLIDWNDMPIPRKIYASENCPSEIKSIVTGFIKEEFPIK